MGRRPDPAKEVVDALRGQGATMNSADPLSANTAAKVRDGGLSANPDAKVPSDLYPNPPGVTDSTPGASDD